MKPNFDQNTSYYCRRISLGMYNKVGNLMEIQNVGSESHTKSLEIVKTILYSHVASWKYQYL